MVSEMFNILGFTTEPSNCKKIENQILENCDNSEELTMKNSEIIFKIEEEQEKTQQFERLLPNIQFEK